MQGELIELYYILKDHLGSASAVTDSNGDIVDEQRYMPYGQPRLTGTNLPTDRLFTGQITWVNPAVNPDTRAIALEARVENKGGLLKAHAFARGEIITDPGADTLTVPGDTVITFAGVHKVFVITDGKAQPREVTLGERRGPDQAILTGLTAGEKVILGGISKIQPGLPVVVK